MNTDLVKPQHPSCYSKIELFKKVIVVFWAVWWLIAFWTDVVGALAHMGLLHQSWAPDTNYPFLVESLKMYHLPSWAITGLFVGIIAWSALSTIAFVIAALSLGKPTAVWKRRANIAFIISLAYWLAFFLADQLVMKFDLEENHMVQGSFQLLCYLAFCLLPSSHKTHHPKSHETIKKIP
jgi:hypothetical protein